MGMSPDTFYRLIDIQGNSSGIALIKFQSQILGCISVARENDSTVIIAGIIKQHFN
jgi:hypothetical protein